MTPDIYIYIYIYIYIWFLHGIFGSCVSTALGFWLLHGPSFLGCGYWSFALGPSLLVLVARSLALGPWLLACGSWSLQGSWSMARGLLALGPGLLVLI